MDDFKSFVQEVKRANDIVDVIGSYLELRKTGTNFMARCPFHGEKTPSFSVNQRQQFYHCFGCGESGDVISFVQKYESCSWWEALELLAKRAGLKMPETSNDHNDDVAREKKEKRDLYLSILAETGKFYYRNFRSEKGAVARRYMSSRGFTDETLNSFGIGYSPDMDSLPQHLRSLGFKDEDGLKCGVLQTTSYGRVFDALAGRLIVPIYNMSGKAIAFGGRGLDERTIEHGKYKNTSETPIFLKKDNLFALNVAKKEKQKSNLDRVIIMEGYMDVIALYQYGVVGAVASMGTSLTENQAKLISRLTDKVYVCYDGDSAGQKATVRGMDILDKSGLEVKVMSIPRESDVKDPDEYVKKYGVEKFNELIETALPLPDYKIKLLDEAFNIKSSDSAVKNDALAKYVKGALKMLSQLDDARQMQYLTVVSRRTGFSEDYFRRKLTENTSEEEDVVETVSTLTPATKAKYFVAASLLAGQDFAVIDKKPKTDSAFLSDLFDYLFECKQNGQAPQTDMLYTVCRDYPQEEYERIIGLDFSKENKQKNKQYFAECKVLIEEEELKNERDKLLVELKTAENTVDVYQKIEQINEKIKQLHN